MSKPFIFLEQVFTSEDSEEYMAMQKANEKRVRTKNRRQHLLCVCLAVALLLLADTTLQYILATMIIVGGWIVLWFSQKAPFGPDEGMPRTHGLPPIIGAILFIDFVAVVIACVAFGISVFNT